MAEKMLEVRDLKVYFEVKKSLASSLFGKPQVLKAVDGVSFDINRGEILSLVGESGSGKTTTGKAILQLAPVTEGSIRFHGEEIVGRKDLSEFRKNAQMIYQDPYQSLNPRQYISDIVGEALDVNGLVSTQEERESKIKEALEDAGLSPADDYMYRRPFELSGGQKRRVAIACVLAMKPEVLILDEPTAGLDPKGRTEILEQISELRRKSGITILLVSHSMEDVAEYVDRILVMNKGKLVYDDKPREVFKHYKELEQIGLAAPQVTYIMHELKEIGMDVDVDATTIEEAAESIKKAL